MFTYLTVCESKLNDRINDGLDLLVACSQQDCLLSSLSDHRLVCTVCVY